MLSQHITEVHDNYDVSGWDKNVKVFLQIFKKESFDANFLEGKI